MVAAETKLLARLVGAHLRIAPTLWAWRRNCRECPILRYNEPFRSQGPRPCGACRPCEQQFWRNFLGRSFSEVKTSATLLPGTLKQIHNTRNNCEGVAGALFANLNRKLAYLGRRTGLCGWRRVVCGWLTMGG